MVRLLFFKGHGIVPCLIRLFCWHWWLGERWGMVPSHVAIAFVAGRVLHEYEATAEGIVVSLLAPTDLPLTKGLIADIPVDLPEISEARRWLDQQIGKPYGYIAVAATGLGIISPPWLDRWWLRLWELLSGGKSGRTAPLDCSLLCQLALRAGGLHLPGRSDGLPVSPNDLFQKVRTL